MNKVRFVSFRRVSVGFLAGVITAGAILVPGVAQAKTVAVVNSAVAPQMTNVIVQFTPGTSARAEAASLSARGGRVARVYENAVSGVAVSLPPAAIQALARNPRVASVEPDVVVSAAGTQSSPTWGLDRSDQRALPLSRSYTWDSAGAGVAAYIVDTGIRADHVDFGGRVSAGFTSINDGNGTNDCHGHGTHVAGTTAGTTYGMAKSATLVPVRVMDCAGSGLVSNVIAGLDWIVKHHESGPAVANLSLATTASATLDNAVRAVIADGVTVVIAAGNSNVDACNASPSRTLEAITVGATTSVDARASYSNVGPCLDLFAPGSSVTAAGHTSSTAVVTRSGTSMAAPHVAGAAALLLSANPSLTPAQVAGAITSNATTGVVTSAGTGSPNSLLYSPPVSPTPPTTTPPPTTPPAPPAATAPAPPTNVVATATGRTTATVSWTRGSDGGSPITSHTVSVFQGSQRVMTMTVIGPVSTTRIAALRANTSYTFRVSATNAVGTSPLSVASRSIRTAR